MLSPKVGEVYIIGAACSDEMFILLNQIFNKEHVIIVALARGFNKAVIEICKGISSYTYYSKISWKYNTFSMFLRLSINVSGNPEYKHVFDKEFLHRLGSVSCIHRLIGLHDTATFCKLIGIESLGHSNKRCIDLFLLTNDERRIRGYISESPDIIINGTYDLSMVEQRLLDKYGFKLSDAPLRTEESPEDEQMFAWMKRYGNPFEFIKAILNYKNTALFKLIDTKVLRRFKSVTQCAKAYQRVIKYVNIPKREINEIRHTILERALSITNSLDAAAYEKIIKSYPDFFKDWTMSLEPLALAESCIEHHFTAQGKLTPEQEKYATHAGIPTFDIIDDRAEEFYELVVNCTTLYGPKDAYSILKRYLSSWDKFDPEERRVFDPAELKECRVFENAVKHVKCRMLRLRNALAQREALRPGYYLEVYKSMLK